MIQVGMIVSDRYEILEKIGTGGMSVVYKAKDVKLGRYVAIKILKDEYCYDDEFVRKFKVEAQASASLSHPNIINIYDVGNDGKIYYIVMEFLDGLTLKEQVRVKGKMSNEDTMRVGAAIAAALDCAHNNHIFHRDIKPQNIIITKEGRIKVLDFGIARIATGATIPAADMASGSVHYIPPEQAKGGYSNEKSDIYSLGISMYEMITGEVPFTADSAVSVALKQIHDKLPDMKALNPEINKNLESIIIKATQKSQELRYQSAEAMLDDLKRASNFPEEDFVSVTSYDDNAETMIMSQTQMRQIWSESDVMEDENKMLDRVVTGSAIFSAIVVVAVIVNFVFSAFKEDIIPVEVTVPQIVGMELTQATAELTPLALSYQIYDTIYSDDVPKDVIIDQQPISGTIVGENTVIDVIVSQGQELFRVPDVSSRGDVKFDVAEELIKNAKLVPEIKREYNEVVPVGIVYNQNPAANSEVTEGTVVTILVSLGKEDKYVIVPDVSRKPLEEAIAILKAAGLTVSENITEAHNEVVEEGNVIAITVEAGTSVKEGYEVDVTVSLGAELKAETKNILINNLLNSDQDSALLRVTIEVGSEEEEIYNSIVSHADFDSPISIPVTGFGTVTYKVYKDGNLEYRAQLKLTEEIAE